MHGGYINKMIVVNYINNLDLARLMHALNYYLRGDSVNVTNEQI